VTCADASHCAMIGFVEHNGTVKDQTGVTSGKDAVQYTVIAFSSDGGAAWTTSTLPRTIPYPMMDALTCYAAGSDLIAQRIGNTYNMDIGQIQCPMPDACVAIGVFDQGSASTPIYTNHG
jgi:hypothetical protein